MEQGCQGELSEIEDLTIVTPQEDISIIAPIATRRPIPQRPIVDQSLASAAPLQINWRNLTYQSTSYSKKYLAIRGVVLGLAQSNTLQFYLFEDREAAVHREYSRSVLLLDFDRWLLNSEIPQQYAKLLEWRECVVLGIFEDDTSTTSRPDAKSYRIRHLGGGLLFYNSPAAQIRKEVAYGM
jgi:hypothetical protein